MAKDWVIEKSGDHTLKVTAPDSVEITKDISVEDLMAALATSIRYRSKGGDGGKCGVDTCSVDFA